MATAMPKVRYYPACLTCGVPYVLRHGFDVMNGGAEDWCWQRDRPTCKHKDAPAWFETANPKKGILGGRIKVGGP